MHRLWKGLRAEKIDARSWAAGKPGISVRHLNLVGAAPIAALEGHWRRIQVRSFGKTLPRQKAIMRARAEACLAAPFLP